MIPKEKRHITITHPSLTVQETFREFTVDEHLDVDDVQENTVDKQVLSDFINEYRYDLIGKTDNDYSRGFKDALLVLSELIGKNDEN